MLLAACQQAPPTPSAATDAAPLRYWGAFREAAPTQTAAGLQRDYGAPPATVVWFDSWGRGKPFPVAEAQALWRAGILPHCTWEPWHTTLKPDDPRQIHLQDIVGGAWDGYIRARAAEFKAAGVPIALRFAHEFNGDWYPWSLARNGRDAALYVRAYRHVHDLVAAAGADNVQWVWTFNNASVPPEAWNDPAAAYPGDAYVDWIGIDGYNFGDRPAFDPTRNHWASFADTYAAAYAKAQAIAPAKPVMAAELASSEDGGDKGAWIAEMNARLRAGEMPELRAFAWFDHDKEERWSAASSPGARQAFIDWVRAPHMAGTGAALAGVPAAHARRKPMNAACESREPLRAGAGCPMNPP